MYLNYFVYNGQKYYTGTVVKLRSGKAGSFICRIAERDWSVFKVDGYRMIIPGDCMQSTIVSITDQVNKNVHMPVQKTFKDSDIDGLSLGWVWYIFLMLISILFKDCIKLWIVISVLFFGWRALKIKEEGNYYEW